MAKPKKSFFIVGVVTDDPDGWEVVCKRKSKSITFRLETKTDKLGARDVMFLNSHLDAIRNNPAVSSPKNERIGQA